MIAKVVALVLGVVVVGAVIVGALAVVPAPTACTPDVAPGSAADARASWDAWAGSPAPASVTFTEADATAVLREQAAGMAIEEPVVHFCADGTAQVSFTYPAGPVSIKGLATGAVEPTSPLSVTVTSIQVGGLPSAVTDPIVGSIRDIAADASSLGLAGPVESVVVTEGQAVISQ